MNTAPLPWKVDETSINFHWKDSISIIDAENGEVAVLTRGYQSNENGGCPSWDNAQLIISAVNTKLTLDALIAKCIEAKKGNKVFSLILNNCQWIASIGDIELGYQAMGITAYSAVSDLLITLQHEKT